MAVGNTANDQSKPVRVLAAESILTKRDGSKVPNTPHQPTVTFIKDVLTAAGKLKEAALAQMWHIDEPKRKDDRNIFMTFVELHDSLESYDNIVSDMGTPACLRAEQSRTSHFDRAEEIWQQMQEDPNAEPTPQVRSSPNQHNYRARTHHATWINVPPGFVHALCFCLISEHLRSFL